MNFLELVQEVDKLALIQGTVDSTTPTSGFQASMVAAVSRANTDIHMLRKDWLFNHTRIQVPLSASVDTYTPTGIRAWETVIYNRSKLVQYDYETYLYQDWTTPGSPSKYSVGTDKSLIFNTPDDNYIVDAHGYLNPDTLTANTDIPRIPEEYHLLIVYKALIILGSTVFLSNLVNEYTISYNEMVGQMMRDYVPSRNTKRRQLV